MDRFESRVATRLARLLIEDEAEDWKEVAERLSSEALDKGIILPGTYGSDPHRWARDMVSAIGHRVDYAKLSEGGYGYSVDPGSVEVAEELFWWLVSPLHVSDY